MMRFVGAHDMHAVCQSCDTTVEAVAREAGLLEDELRLFARGRIPLSAKHRLAILVALHRHAPPDVQAPIEVRNMVLAQQGIALEAGRRLISEAALDLLMQEIADERDDAQTH